MINHLTEILTTYILTRNFKSKFMNINNIIPVNCYLYLYIDYSQTYNYLYTIMQKIIPNCPYNNKAYYVCSNPDCTFNPFICQSNCQCEIYHRQCEKISWQYIKDKLNCSIVKKNPMFQSFSNNMESLYQNVLKQITKAFEDFKQWKNNFGFTEKEYQFLKLIEEGKYNEITGSDIAGIRKQIRTPSKIIMKTQRQIKEKVLMANTYAQSMLIQFSELYSKNKVVKKNIENINQDQNNIEQNNQNKINLAHRLLGLNEKGSKFLMILNENTIQTKLQKLIKKINSNEGAIMKAVDLKIEQLRQNIKDQKKQITEYRNEIKKEILQSQNQIKTYVSQFITENKTQNNQIKKEINQNKIQNNNINKELTQLRNETKTQYNAIKKQIIDIKNEATQIKNQNKVQYNDIKKVVNQLKTQSNQFKKEITQFRKENKQQHLSIKKHADILKQQIIIETKFNNLKSYVNSQLHLENKQLKIFLPQCYQKKIKIAEQLNKIEQKIPLILKNHIENNLAVEKLNEQFILIQKQIKLIRRQFDLLGNQIMKIKAISFLFRKKIVKLNLLYRASQNNFQISKFWDKCNGIQHTITIVKTEFGNVIGGYTPLPWNTSKSGYHDSHMETFIFSLTNKHKLTLIQGKKSKAILHNINYGPIFGGGQDLLIYDKANENTSSYAIPGNTYNYNNEYIGNQQSIKKLSGQSSGCNFKIQEWQVYSIVFNT